MVCEQGHVCRGNGLWEVGYIVSSGTRDSLLVSRSVLNDFADDALTTTDVSLFQNGTARMLTVYWRRWVEHLCWRNL